MAGIVNKVLHFSGFNGRQLLERTVVALDGQLQLVQNNAFNIQVRFRRPANPKMKYPLWYLQKTRVEYPEKITPENREFIKEVTQEKFGPTAIISGIPTYQTSSPLKEKPLEKGQWTPDSRRCGLITRKIGQYCMWSKSGDIVWTTLLQVVDNHVVKYTPPEEVDPPRKPNKFLNPNKFGCILVGAESCDPQKFTKEYCGLFAHAGLPPKRVLGRFYVTPNASLQAGTPLSALHFQPGDVVDVFGTSKSVSIVRVGMKNAYYVLIVHCLPPTQAKITVIASSSNPLPNFHRDYEPSSSITRLRSPGAFNGSQPVHFKKKSCYLDSFRNKVNRGFQGVMKRWGFKGMPGSHGVTKTHRRPGNIGGGGEKGRVWPGTKMPGHMGNKWRYLRGLKIWRINTKYNVLYVQGLGVPGETNSIVHVRDTILPLRKKKGGSIPPHFPTYDPSEDEEVLEDYFDADLHPFDAPSITYDSEKK